MEENEGKDVRTMMQEALQKFNIKQVDVARETGVHHSTLSLWLQGKVRGHQIKIEETLTEWLNNLYNNKPRYTTLNKTTNHQHQLTPTALTFKPKSDRTEAEILVPVHIDLELQGKRYKEAFLWNINEPYMTPEDYSRLLIEENPQLLMFEQSISDTIKKAVAAHRIYASNPKESIKVLELDVQYDNVALKDRFEWDINEPLNSPEEFAWELCQELQLSSEFCVKIAHQIREQIEYYRRETDELFRVEPLNLKRKTRNLIELSQKANVADFRSATNEHNYLRSNVEGQLAWEPTLELLDATEIQRFEKLEERKHRYSRRNR